MVAQLPLISIHSLMYALSQNDALAPIIEPLLGQPNYVSRTGYDEYGLPEQQNKDHQGKCRIAL